MLRSAAAPNQSKETNRCHSDNSKPHSRPTATALLFCLSSAATYVKIITKRTSLVLGLEVPTVKGAKQKAPSFLTFEVTSEQQEDIGPFLIDVKKLVHDAGIVLVSEQRL